MIKLLLNYKKNLFFILSLILLENIAWIIEPTVFGKVLDEFIDNSFTRSLSFQEQHMKLLLLWVLLFFINSFSGSLRRKIEPVIFQNIYTDIATNIANRVNENMLEPSKGAARVQLSEQLITFLQYRIPEMMEQIISFGGAILALLLIDWRISIICLIVGIPLALINAIYNKKVFKEQTALHNNYEEIYDAFNTKNPENVKRIFRQMSSHQKKIGFWGAVNFLSLRLVLLIIFIFVIYIAIDIDNFTTGIIYTVVTYLWTFISTVEYLPDLMESKSSLKDILIRIKI